MKPHLIALFIAWCLTTPTARGEDPEQDGAGRIARTRNSLGIAGTKFTIGGEPTFLLGVSYFDAVGWQQADLDALQARRFNLIRIFLDWSILDIKDGAPTPQAARGFVQPDGSLTHTETLLALVRACAVRGIMVDVTILTSIYDAAKPVSKTLDMPSRERAVRNAIRLLKHEPNVFFDVCNEHNVAYNGKATTLTHDEAAALIRVALDEHPGAIVTVSSGGDHMPNARNIREELDAGVMLVAPHFQRNEDWFDRTDDRVKSVKEHIKSAGRNVPVYLQEEQRRGWTKVSPPKSEFLQAAREAREAGAGGWVFHTYAGFDLRSKSLLENLDEVEREVIDSLGATVFGTESARASRSPASGPLRVHPTNPRYFTDGTKRPAGSLRAVYLTGSHTWNNQLDMGRDDPPKAFDFDAYLDFLSRHHHNFIRLWAWSSTLWDTRSALEWVEQGAIYHVAPQPWRRTGPGLALDGRPKFDLEAFDAAYFERLRSRIIAAGRGGIYVSVMLFEGWTLSFDSTSWTGHPFRKENNIQGIDGDPNGDGKGLEIQTLSLPRVTRLQEAYVRKVIETVNDLDNVLYEVSNEARLLNPASSTKEWQYHLIRFIKNEEAKRNKQHPVGMTSQGGGGGDDSVILRSSGSDWISPNSDKSDYKINPPPNDTGKVVLLDTDHLWGVGGDAAWVWKSFIRGHNPIFMDPYEHLILGKGSPSQWEGARQALGATRRLAERVDLAMMTPSLDLASTKYCLAQPGREYLVYQPATGGFAVNLPAGNYGFEWFNPTTGATAATGSVKVSGGSKDFTPPFPGPAVLHLKLATATEALRNAPASKPETPEDKD